MNEIRRICKAADGRIIDGVCAGIADYLGIEPLWIRIGWIALSLLGGIGIVAYAIAMVIFPRSEDLGSALASARSRQMIGATVLIGIGLFFLLAGGFARYDFWAAWKVAWYIFLPLSLIAGGGVILLAYFEQSWQSKILSRSSTDKRFLGVCAGLAQYFGKDPNLIRFLFAIVTVLSRGVGLLVYVLMAVLISEEGKSQGSTM